MLLQAAPLDTWADLIAVSLAVRTQAVQRLTGVAVSDPALLEEPSVQRDVIEALELENAVVLQNLDLVMHGAKPLFGEEYGEHYSRLLSLADRLRERENLSGALRARLIRALVGGVYNDDSAFAQQLAREGDVLVTDIVDLTRSSNEPARWNAFGLIAHVLEGAETNTLRAPLSSSSRARLQAAARLGLQDRASGVRGRAIKAVVAAKDRDAIPYLLHLAQTDPDTGPQGLSVRELAAAGVDALRRGQ